MKIPRIERAFGRLLSSQSRLRGTTAGLESSQPRGQLDAIVRAQLEHLDELIGRVAGYLRVATPAVAKQASHRLNVALLVEHATVAHELRDLESMCRGLREPGLAHFAKELLSEHSTLSSGLSRLVDHEVRSSTGALAHA
jgi:uncharacterized membrane protein